VGLNVTSKHPRWLRGDFHVHSNHSDGALTPAELADLARDMGLDFIAVTDHNSISAWGECPMSPDLTVIKGMEWSRYGGHCTILGYPDMANIHVFGECAAYRKTASGPIPSIHPASGSAAPAPFTAKLSQSGNPTSAPASTPASAPTSTPTSPTACVAQEVSAAGGVLSIAHPFDDDCPWRYGFPEIDASDEPAQVSAGSADTRSQSNRDAVNEGIAAVRRPCGPGSFQHGDVPGCPAPYLLEIWNGAFGEKDMKTLALWQSLLAAGIRISIIGGSDFHRDVIDANRRCNSPDKAIGPCGPSNPDEPAQKRQLPTQDGAGRPHRLAHPLTYVHGLSQAPGDILEAARLGRGYIAAGPDAPTMDLDAGLWDGAPGDFTVTFRALPTGAIVRLIDQAGCFATYIYDSGGGHPTPHDDCHFVALVRDAAQERVCDIHMQPATHPGPTAHRFVRFEVWGAGRPLLIANPIYLF
jgi:hypothetical protein